MSERQVPSMDPEFPIWYREVSIGDDRERMQRRWRGLCALVDAATRADVEAMISSAFKTKAAAQPTSLIRIGKAFKDADDLFSIGGNDREMEVLCGAGLILLCRAGAAVSAAAALAITTAAAAGGRTPKVSLDLVAAAEAGLAAMAEAVRKRPNLDQYAKAVAPKFDFENAAVKVRGQQNFEGVIAAFGLAADAVRENVAGVARQNKKAVAAVNQFIAVQDEELQMLWWLVGQRSWDFDTAFASVPADAQALVLPKELADLTKFLPGPASVKGLLGRAGLKDSKKITIPLAVNACDKTWLGKLIDGLNPSPVTQPIHFAVKRKVETGEATAWVAGWAAVTGLDAVHKLTAVALGNQFYRERLLAVFPEE